MTVHLELTSERPGFGRLIIRNLVLDGELRVCFQRPTHQDLPYLGPDKKWQQKAHWHVIEGVVAQGNESNCQVGPDIIDGLLSSSSSSLRVSVQGSGVSDEGRMRIIGRLLGSGAAGSSIETVSISRAGDHGSDDESFPDVPECIDDAHTVTEPPQLQSPPSLTQTDALDGSGKKPWLWVVLVLLVLLASLTSSWYFGLFKMPGVPDPVTSILNGRARAQAYLGAEELPAPKEMFEDAANWEREGDCEAAIIVYQMAAQADIAQAARYARRYDPESFEASPCISGADAETAAYWYEGPAAAGEIEAQRQLGKILVGKYNSGVLREQGESWLRRASQGGDRDAQALIEKLGISEN